MTADDRPIEKRMVKGSSNGFYEFSKVYVPNHSSQRLELPLSFEKHFKGAFPQTSQLELRNMNNVWTVNLIKVEEKIIIEKGWEEFVKDTRLVFGDFLIFRYDGSSQINVQVFGFNGFEKDFVFLEEQQGGKRRKICKTGSLCSKPVRVDDKTKTRELEHLRHENSTAKKINPSRRGTSILQNNTYVEAAVKELKSNNPHFELYMHKSYLAWGQPHINTPFAKKHMNKDKRLRNSDVKLCISNQSWTVTMKVSNGSKLRWCKFSGGWHKFATDNNLMEGDVCIFELIKELVFEVTIVKQRP